MCETDLWKTQLGTVHSITYIFFGDTCAQLPDEGTEAIDIRGLAGLLTGQEDSWAEPVVEAVPARAAAHRVTRLLPLSRRKRDYKIL